MKVRKSCQFAVSAALCIQVAENVAQKVHVGKLFLRKTAQVEVGVHIDDTVRRRFNMTQGDVTARMNDGNGVLYRFSKSSRDKEGIVANASSESGVSCLFSGPPQLP